VTDTSGTERLYYRDAYLAAFDACVVERAGEGGRRVYLDRTAFYPTSGGQPHDLGTISGVPVEDVIDEGERIAHLLAAALPDDAVHGSIDWTRRHDHMQQHTGQHLVSALFADRYGAETISVHFGPEVSTLDVDREPVSEAWCREVEREANEIVATNRAVTVTFEAADRATGLRKPSDREGTIRVVSIDAVDRSACGGTHVRDTAGIGVVLLRRTEKVRKATRIEFVCGARAVRRARRDFEELTRVARLLSASIDDVPGLVEAQGAELRESLSVRRRLEEELNAYRAAERHRTTAPGTDGLVRVAERSAAGTPDEWRGFALAFSGLPRTVFVAASDTPPAVLLATSPDSGIDAGRALRAALERAGGRGGGSPRLAQGSLPSSGAVEAVVRELMSA
jgi:alanyl-tRNA synthetase